MIELDRIGSLKVTVGFVPALTPVAPFAGVNPVTTGGVVSCWIRELMSIATSAALSARS